MLMIEILYLNVNFWWLYFEEIAFNILAIVLSCPKKRLIALCLCAVLICGHH